MKKSIFWVMIFFGSFIGLNGQESQSPPKGQSSISSEKERARNYYGVWDRAREEFNKTIFNANPRVSQTEVLKVLSQNITPLYRDLTEEEKKVLAPSQDDFTKYAVFLRQPRTGLVKLSADVGCADHPGVVVDASVKCLRYSMPGAGSSFSFRANKYRIRRLADITFTNDSFQTTGKMLHGIVVNIGEIPLEEVGMNTKAVKFLAELKPSRNLKEAAETDNRLITGIENGGLNYRSGVSVKLNSTYILRSIAYRTIFMRAIQNVNYDEFEFDKRKDAIVVFQVVSKGEDGSVTILWKELQSKRSPNLKISKRKQSEIKDNKFVARKTYK